MDIEKLNQCKDKYDLLKFAETLSDNSYKVNLIKKIRASSYEVALQAVWNAALQEEGKYFLGKEVTRNCWFKGTAIGGMECSGH